MAEAADYEVRISDDAEGMAALAAATIARWLTEAGELASIGLSGGNTPLPTYKRLCAEPVDWESVTAWIVDERWVPHDHPDSNSGMVKRTLTDQVGVELLEIDLGVEEPDEAAAEYEDSLAAALMDTAGHLRPGLVLLGIGEDGHTASLFPDTDALDERERSYVANWVPQLEAWRLTATLPLLWSAERLAFLVTGEAKARMVAGVINGASGLPAGTAAGGAREVTWFLDSAAASQL